MSADGSSPTPPMQSEAPGTTPGSSPTASLTMVRVARRRQAAQTGRKRGDLTQHLVDAAPEPLPAIERPSEPMVEAPAPAIETPPASELPSAAAPEVVDEPAFQRLAGPFDTPLDSATAEVEPDYAPMERMEAEPEEDHVVIPMPLSSRAEEQGVEEADRVEAPAGYAELGPRTAEEIIDYWDILAGTSEFPAASQLDRDLIATCWPNSVLLTFGQAETPTITRLGEPNGEIEYNAMVTDWILSRGKQAALRVEALEEEQRFHVKAGRERYRLVLLPLSNDGSKVDHMLCHLSRLEQLKGVAAFKRWLAS